MKNKEVKKVKEKTEKGEKVSNLELEKLNLKTKTRRMKE